MPEVRRVLAFLLSREWRDTDDGIELVFWARSEEGPVRLRVPAEEAVMFVPRDAVTRAGRRVSRALTTFDGRPVDALYFRSRRAMWSERDRLREAGFETLESDVKPADRWVMERFVTGGFTVLGPCRARGGILHFDRGGRVAAAELCPSLSLLSLDVETDGLGGPLLSAAVATAEHERVFVRRPAREVSHVAAVVVPDERALLTQLFAEIVRLDPDVLCGWNVLEFDLALLDRRARELGVPFAIGRGGERARVVASASGRASIARVPGRVVLDGIATLKSATYAFERYTLEVVSQELLGRGKKVAEGALADPVAEIRRLHDEEPDALVEYNLEDCRLVLDIFRRADLVGFAVERARLTGLPLDRQGGSVAAFDHLYLPRVHRRGYVARDVEVDVELLPSPGGHVLDSTPGLYRDVLSFDFRSLYPSIIRTFQIDPLALAQPGDDPVPGEDGATFAREGAILPALIASLAEARRAALAADGGNSPRERAIKILMNSFYGVLGTPGCRFFDPRLPTSITRRGHAILARAGRFFTERGLAVIYGDTDSLFVAGGDPTAGHTLAAELTALLAAELRAEHRLESFLELRFESHYERFLMPTLRHSELGSKKRYAGAVRKTPDGPRRVVVRGLEAVRRDWTSLARRVQLELLRRVFEDEPFEGWLVQTVKELEAGALDGELTYHKRRREGDTAVELALVMTTRGLETVTDRGGAIDYGHYLEKQLAPVCDVILPFVGTSFARVAGAQTNLF